MEMKIVHIQLCEDCPHRRFYVNNDLTCGLVDNDIILNELEGIPEWCLLPSVDV